MSTERELDGLLRPSYELLTIGAVIASTFVLWAYGDLLGLTFFWKVILISYSVYFLFPRIESYFYIKKYQSALNVIDAYHLKASQIEWTEKRQWIGRGFDYQASDAQRVYDASKREYKKFYQLPKFVDWFRRNELNVEKRRGRHTTLKHKLEKKFAEITSAQTYRILWWSIRNHYKPLPPVGGNPLYHATGFDREEEIYINQDDRIGHTMCFGQSRTGKTVWLRSQISQDIARRDGAAGVFDPKGDLELLGIMWSECRRLGREEDFYVFLLGDPEISARYNAIASFSRLTAIAGRIANQMSGSGDGQVFKDFAFNFMTYVAAAQLDMSEKPTFETMKRDIEDLEGLFNRYGRFLMKRDNSSYHEDLKVLETPKIKTDGKEERLRVGSMKGRDYKTVVTDKLTSDFYERNPHLINKYFEGLRSTMKNDGQYVSKLTASLIPLLTKLTSGQIAEIISPKYNDMSDERRTFSWDKIIQRKGVFYVGLSSMQDEVVADAVGASFFSDLVAKAGEINNYGVNKGLPGSSSKDITPIWLHCDEFQALITGDGSELTSILNRSGSAGVRVCAYSQTRSDFEAKLGDAAKANVMLGNFNSIVMLRVEDEYTAEYLTSKVAEVDYLGIDVTGGVNDGGSLIPQATFTTSDDATQSKGGFFGSRTASAVKIENRAPIISPSTIMSLPKGQAFALINRKYLYKLRFPILHDDSGVDIGDMFRIREELKARQARPEYH
ncbi:conjugative transfer system coupling protein TraD [Vibrio sp. A8-1]|uniref:conjugative transfer system coupling protein TraD n=1 Tax=Vibrio sp. A8-1 TaxID=2591023 RepID=UPI00148236A9|nr:conjugative transfer system coupling protein TraD [Vibrio sp. A8-1]